MTNDLFLSKTLLLFPIKIYLHVINITTKLQGQYDI